MKTAEEPGIQSGQAQPSTMYNYLTIQKTGLGLARANVGTAKAIIFYGIIDIIVGLGLALTGVAIFRKLPGCSGTKPKDKTKRPPSFGSPAPYFLIQKFFKAYLTSFCSITARTSGRLPFQAYAQKGQ